MEKQINFTDSTIMQARSTLTRPLSISKQGRDLTTQLAEDVAEEMLEEESLKEVFEAVKRQMLDWVRFEDECEKLTSVVETARDMAQRDEIDEDTDLEALLGPKFQQVLSGEGPETKQLKKTAAWREFIEKVKEVLAPENRQNPNVNDSDDDDDDDDMLVTQEETNINCPITRKPFANPLKNKICHHTYDEQGVDILLAQRGEFRCPVPSCNNQTLMTRADLEPDRRMLRIIKARKK